MKKIKALSLVMLIASAQLHSAAATNAELAMVLSYQALDNFARTISSDRDDIGALQMLDFMNKAISFDAQQKQQIAAAQDGYLSKGTPLDPVKIEMQNKELQSRINTLNHNVKAFEKGGVTAVEKKKVDARRDERNKKMAMIKANQAALSAQDAAKADADKKAQAAQALIDQNELAFEQALESYIGSFGQVYANKGSIVISSKYNKEMPITPKEYAQLVATLKNASSQFGSAVSINLNLNNAAPATIKDVVNYVGNMAPASASYLSYAGYALAATALTAATIAAVAVGANIYQGKDWNDLENTSNLYDAGAAQAQAIADSSVGQKFATGYAAAQAQGQAAYQQVANSPVGQSIATFTAAGASRLADARQYVENQVSQRYNALGSNPSIDDSVLNS